MRQKSIRSRRRFLSTSAQGMVALVGRASLGMMGGVLGSFGSMASAQTATSWPQRPIKWIVSQPAGAGPDIIARFIAEQLVKVLGQQIVIENRPGGQNVIGAQAAARAAADGYTFFYGTTAAMVTNSFTFKSLPYDPDKDFVPVSLIGRSPFVIAANASSGFKTLAEALSAARLQPDKVGMATEGPKTFSGMLAESVASLTGVKFLQIPYTKASDAIQDVIGGRVALICLPDAALTPFIKSGQLMALAVSTGSRVAALPQVPALSETVSGFEYTGWNGLFAPAGTSGDVVQRMNRELAQLLKQPEMVQRLLSLGSIADGSLSPAEVSGFVRSERERWSRIVKAIGITAE
jgi:tripartite-type tricarboxylate transporter receptor subunit TctC